MGMISEKDRYLLLSDLCARLPYGVKCEVLCIKETLNADFVKHIINDKTFQIKPYLRPMSSLTYDEVCHLCHLQGLVGEVTRYNVKDFDTEGEVSVVLTYIGADGTPHDVFHYLIAPCKKTSLEVWDWLNENFLDFRGLIARGLALEAPKKMYKEKK